MIRELGSDRSASQIKAGLDAWGIEPSEPLSKMFEIFRLKIEIEKIELTNHGGRTSAHYASVRRS